jgi:hypothetical protein
LDYNFRVIWKICEENFTELKHKTKTQNLYAIYISGKSWSRSQVMQKCSISPQQLHNNYKVFNNNNIPLLCKIVKHLFCIPPILVVWWLTTSQTGAFATDLYIADNI